MRRDEVEGELSSPASTPDAKDSSQGMAPDDCTTSERKQPMPTRRTRTTCLSMTIGQLAKRWGIGRAHVRQLLDSGCLAGVFTIPSGAVTGL